MTELIAAGLSGMAVIISALILRKSQQIHLLVNSRLDATIAEIADLKKQRDDKAARESPPA
jgi:hypothetical protein